MILNYVFKLEFRERLLFIIISRKCLYFELAKELIDNFTSKLNKNSVVWNFRITELDYKS